MPCFHAYLIGVAVGFGACLVMVAYLKLAEERREWERENQSEVERPLLEVRDTDEARRRN